MFVDFNILNQLGSPSINSNTFANRPAAGQTGRLFVSTDTFEIYRDNGTTWDLIGGPGSSTITGTGTATQVAYFTSSQAIGSSANLFWDNTSGFLGVATATPTARIEAVKTDGIGIYANYTTVAGAGSTDTGLWTRNVTNGNGYAAVIEERTPNTASGQYPLLIKHSLSAGTAAVGMGTGLQFQLPDDAGTFKTTQLTIETINAAAATYATRYRFNVQSNGSSTPVAYINATGVGIFTATPGAALDVHSTGTIAQFNTTSATGNTYIAFQRTGTGLWRIGDTYNAGNNFFELHNTVLGVDAMEFEAATNKSTFQAQQTYTTGLARGNYFDYNLSVAAGGSFSSPNAITALTATLDLTLAGNATIPSGARSGLDAYNTIAFTGAGTLTHTQGTQIRAYSNLTAGWAFNGSAVGTITHLAGLRALFPDNSGSAVNVTNNYALLLNDQTANTGTVTYTNRWGIYQEGTSDLNYIASNLLIGSTTNNGNRLQVTGSANITSGLTFNTGTATTSFIVGGTTPVYTVFNTTSSTATTRLATFYRGTQGFDGTLPTTYGNPYLVIGGQENNTNSIQSIGFGFNNGSFIPPAEIGFQTTSLLGYTIGDLVFATRAATTNTAPLERMRITSAGKVFIQTSVASSTNAYGQGDLSIENNLFASLQVMTHNSSSGNFSFLGLGKSRGTGAAPTVVADGEILSEIQNYGYDGSSYRVATQIRTVVQGTPAAGYVPGYLSFQTNNGSLLERARITSSGNFLIGTTTDAGQKLQVAGQVYSTGVNVPFYGTSADSNGTILQLQTTFGTSYTWGLNSYTNGYLYFQAGITNAAYLTRTGDLEIIGNFKTGAPSGGTAAVWKLGSRVAATVVVNTNEYIEVDIGGTLYKLATVT